MGDFTGNLIYSIALSFQLKEQHCTSKCHFSRLLSPYCPSFGYTPLARYICIEEKEPEIAIGALLALLTLGPLLAHSIISICTVKRMAPRWILLVPLSHRLLLTGTHRTCRTLCDAITRPIPTPSSLTAPAFRTKEPKLLAHIAFICGRYILITDHYV